MSKLTTRVALSVLISLAVIAGIYTTVLSASSGLIQEKTGSHLVSGIKVNLNHYREADPAPVLQPYEAKSGSGHNCESGLQTSPDD